MRYRSDIDGLRAVAVLSVIFFHLELPYITGGFIGVDIFFVISGYLITKIIQSEIRQEKFSLSGFMKGEQGVFFQLYSHVSYLLHAPPILS